MWCNADKRTLLDKMLGLLGILNIGAPCYFVADAYYAAGKIVKGLLKQGHHLVTRVKSNAVAYAPAGPKKGRRKRGRSKVYGKKIKLKSLLWNTGSMQEVASPFTASATSSFAIVFAIYCGVQRGCSSVLSPSFIPPGGLAS